MRLMRYEYEIYHVPGKTLYTADALSRSPQREIGRGEEELQTAVEAYVDSIIETLPTSESLLEEIRRKLHEDSVLRIIMKYCEEGWPGYEYPSIDLVTRPFWQIREELSICQGLLMRGNRLVIPTVLRAEMLQRIHEGHQGILKCRERVRNSVWWPGINREIEDLVKSCSVCVKNRHDQAEPLRPTKFPDRPWEMLGTDLFHLKNDNYLLVVDYFSRYVEIAKLKSTTSQSIVNHLKSIFTRHGIPDILVSDNGPQYSSSVFQTFSKDYGFRHQTSSPHYPQGNGEAERAVRTVKRLIRNADDPYLALMAYRATPLKNGSSPAELLMGRKLRTTLPENPRNYYPKWPDLERVRQVEVQYRQNQKLNFDKSRRARPLSQLNTGETVWVKGEGGGTTGTVKARTQQSDRSYIIETDNGPIRRNRRHLEPASMLKDEVFASDTFDEDNNAQCEKKFST
ncbi:uncharacterized protein K02A2.6-like [Saccostrea cucullata]|uniref:uncharacterized protein K02A2.6-like n=1 Tax=Saccostrea cuccullata TaxID=36930 RepID=UPI002ED3A2B1